MLRALGEYEIEGLVTLIPFHRALLATEQWAKGETCRDLVEDRAWLKGLAAEKTTDDRRQTTEDEDLWRWSRPTPSRCPGSASMSRVFGAAASAPVANGAAPAARKPPRRERASGGGGGDGGADALVSPIQGTVLKVAVEQGAQVEAGALIAVVEAMKMENEITAHKAGTVSELPIAVGASVASGDTLAVITAAE